MGTLTKQNNTTKKKKHTLATLDAEGKATIRVVQKVLTRPSCDSNLSYF